MAGDWIDNAHGAAVPADPGWWIEVRFRGEADPGKGVLRRYGFVHQFNWWHDGAEDDIIAWRRAALPAWAGTGVVSQVSSW